MHKQLLNEALITVFIQATGPILIKSGIEGSVDPAIPDMNFVRTFHHQQGQILYLPGSSLKGVIRSYCEKINRTAFARTVGERIIAYTFEEDKPQLGCCDTFDDSKQARFSCSGIMEAIEQYDPQDAPQKKEQTKQKIKQLQESGYIGNLDLSTKKQFSSAEIYKYSCLACKLFGSTKLASRVAISDFYPTEPYKAEARTNVAIDRILGSALPGALFNMEVLTKGNFKGEIRLRNFELWQLGLLGLALRDLENERLRIGFAKSRGLGQVKAEVNSVTVSYQSWKANKEQTHIVAMNGRKDADGKPIAFPLYGEQDKVQGTYVYGVGKFAEAERNLYGFKENDSVFLPCKISVDDSEENWTRVSFTFNKKSEQDNEVKELFKACVEQQWASLMPE